MGNSEEHPQAPGAPETEGAANPSEVVDHPKGATPSTPGYEATRQQVDAAREPDEGSEETPGTDVDGSDPQEASDSGSAS